MNRETHVNQAEQRFRDERASEAKLAHLDAEIARLRAALATIVATDTPRMAHFIARAALDACSVAELLFARVEALEHRDAHNKRELMRVIAATSEVP